MIRSKPARLIALCLAAISTTVAAQTVAPAQADPAQPKPDGAAAIQRLFFSAEKRAALDRQRTQNLQQIQSVQGATLNLDGIVQRSSGKSTVWINGQPQHESEAARNGVSVFLSPKTPGSAQIAPGDDEPVPMKVGETINRATGESNTRIGNGKVTTSVKPAKSGR